MALKPPFAHGRIRRLAVGGLLLAVAAGYGAYWFHVAGQIPGWLSAWADQARVRGWEVSYGAVAVSGFPLRHDVVVADVVLGGHTTTTQWTWHAGTVTGLSRPWNFETLMITLPAAQTLEVRRGDRGTRLAIGMGTNQSVLAAQDGVLAKFALDAQDVTMRPEAGGPGLAAASLKLRYRLDEADDGSREDGMAGEILDLTLPGPPPPGLPGTITRTAFAITTLGLEPDRDIRRALTSWRDAGGTAEVEAVQLAWGTLDLRVNGTLALDEQFRPLGAFTAKARGYGPLLEAVAADGAITPAQAFALRTALDVLARPGEGGGEAEVEVPVTVQDGKLFVGPIAVTTVGPLPIE